MAAEKIAKAHMCPPSGRPPRTHKAFVRFLQLCDNRIDLRLASGMSRSRFRSHVRGLLHVANALEDLAPVGDWDKPNPEYPWETGGKIISPLDHSFAVVRPTTRPMIKLLEFLRFCLEMA